MLFLDEVERLIPRPGDSAYAGRVREFNAFFGALRALNQEERCLSVLIADIHADANRINYWPGLDVDSNPVFAFFKEVYLPPFRSDETYAMLDGIGRLMGYKFHPFLATDIHAESGGIPIVSRQAASVLIGDRKERQSRETAPRRGEREDRGPARDTPKPDDQNGEHFDNLVLLVDDADSRKCLESLPSRSAFLSNYCEVGILGDMDMKGPRSAGHILRVLAATGTTVPYLALQDQLGADFTEAEIRKALVTLRAYGLVEADKSMTAEGYRILPMLFARWLRSDRTPTKPEHGICQEGES